MDFVFDYEKKEVEGEDARFIGMNTAEGFRWNRDGIPDESESKRTYIIKGAAGTGKSTIMKNVAERFKKDGVPVVRFLCSSDPDSLDAVLIGGEILIIDGTFPHLKDAQYPGALSELVCLGNFWNKEKLILNSAEITDLSDKKASCFRKAYRYMSGMRELSFEMYEDVKKLLDQDKTRRTLLRIISKLKKDIDDPHFSETIIRSFGMKGAIKLSTLENRADKIITVCDVYGTGRVFLAFLAKELKTSRISFILSPDPLFDSQISDIYIPAERLLFTVDRAQKTEKFLNMERFIDKERLSSCRGELRLLYKCWDALRLDSERELRNASDFHFKLERIYGSAMNFEAVSAYQKLLIKEIENRL